MAELLGSPSGTAFATNLTQDHVPPVWGRDHHDPHRRTRRFPRRSAPRPSVGRFAGGDDDRTDACRSLRGFAHQGYRRLRRRARQYAGGLWPGGRPERHRRFADQRALHQGEPDRHAGAPGGQYPRQDRRHHLGQPQECRRRHGHRLASALRPPGHSHRYQCVRHGRRQGSARRHPFGHPADRRRWRGLCREPGSGRNRRLLGLGRFRLFRGQGRAHRRAYRQRGHRRARAALRDGPSGSGQGFAAQSGLHHLAPHRPGGQFLPGRRHGAPGRSRHGSDRGPADLSRQCGGPADRYRAVEGRARPDRPRGHR